MVQYNKEWWNAADGKNLDQQCTKLNMQMLSLESLADNGAKKTVSAIIEPMMRVPKIQTRLLLSKTGYCVHYGRIFLQTQCACMFMALQNFLIWRRFLKTKPKIYILSLKGLNGYMSKSPKSKSPIPKSPKSKSPTPKSPKSKSPKSKSPKLKNKRKFIGKQLSLSLEVESCS